MAVPKKVRKGGLEFLPLKDGRREEDYQVPRGKKHSGQLDFLTAPTGVDERGRKLRR